MFGRLAGPFTRTNRRRPHISPDLAQYRPKGLRHIGTSECVTQGGHPDPWGAASARNLCQVEAGSVGRTRSRDCTPRCCSIAVVPLRRVDKVRDSISFGTPNVFAPGCDRAAAADDGLEEVR